MPCRSIAPIRLDRTPRTPSFTVNEQLQTDHQHEAGPDEFPIGSFLDKLPSSPAGQKFARAGGDGHGSHDGMVQGDFIGGGMVSMSMAEQHHPAHDGKQWQRYGPSRMGKPSEPAQKFYRPDGKCKHPVGLMLDDFVIVAEEALDESQRPDGPGIVIAPNEQKHPAHEERAGKKKSAPGECPPSQGWAQFAEPDQKNKDSSQMMIELRIGDAGG